VFREGKKFRRRKELNVTHLCPAGGGLNGGGGGGERRVRGSQRGGGKKRTGVKNPPLKSVEQPDKGLKGVNVVATQTRGWRPRQVGGGCRHTDEEAEEQPLKQQLLRKRKQNYVWCGSHNRGKLGQGTNVPRGGRRTGEPRKRRYKKGRLGSLKNGKTERGSKPSGPETLSRKGNS